MGKKRKQNNIPDWSYSGASVKQFIPLCNDMVESKAYLSLNNRQRNLYIFMRLQYNGDKNDFTFSWYAANKIYKLYSKQKTFYDDIEALISSGFIVCLECGATTRKKSRYAFSKNWCNYPNIELKPSQMTFAMQRKSANTKTQ